MGKLTVQEIQERVAQLLEVKPKTCEVAEAKERRGHYVARAHNRQGPNRTNIRAHVIAQLVPLMAGFG